MPSNTAVLTLDLDVSISVSVRERALASNRVDSIEEPPSLR